MANINKYYSRDSHLMDIPWIRLQYVLISSSSSELSPKYAPYHVLLSNISYCFTSWPPSLFMFHCPNSYTFSLPTLNFPPQSCPILLVLYLSCSVPLYDIHLPPSSCIVLDPCPFPPV